MNERLFIQSKVFLSGKEREFLLVLGCNHLSHERKGKGSAVMSHTHFVGSGLVGQKVLAW